jgi:hypothetical protein
LICRKSNPARHWLFIAQPQKQLIDIVWFWNSAGDAIQNVTYRVQAYAPLSMPRLIKSRTDAKSFALGQNAGALSTRSGARTSQFWQT